MAIHRRALAQGAIVVACLVASGVGALFFRGTWSNDSTLPPSPRNGDATQARKTDSSSNASPGTPPVRRVVTPSVLASAVALLRDYLAARDAGQRGRLAELGQSLIELARSSPEVLAAVVNDSSLEMDLRALAMRWLAWHAEGDAATLLRDFASGAYPLEIRLDAVYGLGRLRDSGSVPLLAEILRSEDVPIELAKRVLGALGAIADPAAEEALIGALSSAWLASLYGDIAKALAAVGTAEGAMAIANRWMQVGQVNLQDLTSFGQLRLVRALGMFPVDIHIGAVEAGLREATGPTSLETLNRKNMIVASLMHRSGPISEAILDVACELARRPSLEAAIREQAIVVLGNANTSGAARRLTELVQSDPDSPLAVHAARELLRQSRLDRETLRDTYFRADAAGRTELSTILAAALAADPAALAGDATLLQSLRTQAAQARDSMWRETLQLRLASLDPDPAASLASLYETSKRKDMYLDHPALADATNPKAFRVLAAAAQDGSLGATERMSAARRVAEVRFDEVREQLLANVRSEQDMIIAAGSADLIRRYGDPAARAEFDRIFQQADAERRETLSMGPWWEFPYKGPKKGGKP